MAVNLGAAYVDILPSTDALGDYLAKMIPAAAASAGRDAGRQMGEALTAEVEQTVKQRSGVISGILKQSLNVDIGGFSSIGANVGGFTKTISNGLGGIVSKGFEFGRSAGQMFVEAFDQYVYEPITSIGERALGSFTKWGRRGSFAIGGVIAGGVYGGLKRALNRESAEVLFDQMGLSESNVKSMMDGLYSIVLDTPFTTPDASVAAAQFLAAGRTQEQALRDVQIAADAAAFTINKDFSETSELFAKMAAQGRVYATDLTSFGRLGLPMRQMLEQGLGVTHSELAMMVKNGEVTYDTIMEVLGATSQMENASKNLGNTTKGSFLNVKNAWNALFENFLTPWLGTGGTVAETFIAINYWLKTFGDTSVEAGQKFHDSVTGAFRTFVGYVDSEVKPRLELAKGFIVDNQQVIEEIGISAAIATTAITGLGVGVVTLSALISKSPVGIILGLATAFVYAYRNSEEFRDVVDGVIQTVSDNIGPAIENATGLVERLFSSFEDGGTASAFIEDLSIGFSKVVDTVKDFGAALWEPIARNLPDLIAAVSGGFEGITAIVMFFFGVLKEGWEKAAAPILSAIQLGWEGIVNTLTGVVEIVAGVFQIIGGLLTLDLGMVGRGLLAMISGVGRALFEGLPLIFISMVEIAFQVLKTAVELFLGFLYDILLKIWGVIYEPIRNFQIEAVACFLEIQDTVSRVIDAIVEFFRKLPGRITGFIIEVWNRITTWFEDAKIRVIGYYNSLIGWFKALPGRIKDAVSTVYDKIVDPFKRAYNEVKSIWSGLTGSFNPLNILPPRQLLPFHSGGVVPGRKGEEVPTLLMAGETVLPTHLSNYELPVAYNVTAPAAGGPVINIHVEQVAGNPYETADIVARRLGWEMALTGVR